MTWIRRTDSSKRARAGVEQLECRVHLCSAAYPPDQITGLLVLAGTRPGSCATSSARLLPRGGFLPDGAQGQRILGVMGE